MASDQEFVDFIVDQIQGAGLITFRKMFGEYAIYCNGKVVALVCDNQLFVKQSEAGRKYIGEVVEAPAYPGAKMSFLIEDGCEDGEWLSGLISVTADELPEPKPKKKKESKSRSVKKPKLVRIDLDKPIAKLVGKTDHRTLGIWAADCAERVLPYFEEKYPKDDRPRQAIKTLRMWVQTGLFKMAVIRTSSLSAHAAARAVKENDDAARSAARAAGQAVATAHVPAHSLGAAVYSVTAVRDATNSIDAVTKERDWQYQRLLELSKTGGTPSTKRTLWRSRKKSV